MAKPRSKAAARKAARGSLLRMFQDQGIPGMFEQDPLFRMLFRRDEDRLAKARSKTTRGAYDLEYEYDAGTQSYQLFGREQQDDPAYYRELPLFAETFGDLPQTDRVRDYPFAAPDIPDPGSGAAGRHMSRYLLEQLYGWRDKGLDI